MLAAQSNAAPRDTYRSALTAIALGITAIGVVRGGGFFTPDLVGVPLLLVVVVGANPRRVSGADARVLAALALFAAYWLGRGIASDTTGRAASLSASAVAFGAAYVAARRCRSESDRLLAIRALVLIGLLVAIVSLPRWAAYDPPWGLPFDGVWRLSGPFAYPNAAGLFFALAFVANLALNERTWLDRVVSGVILFGALAATASRGALLAVAAGVLTLGLRRFRARTPRGRALLIAAAAAAAAVSVWVALVTFGVIGGTRTTNASASIDDRVAESAAAVRQGREAPVLGGGPERDLLIHNFRGYAIARYAHNELLQVFAGGGLVGVGLLCLVGAAVIAALRDEASPRGRLATASAVVLAVGGLLDFNWHFVGLVAYAGWFVGLDEDAPA